ncbi:MAG: tol-pal system-associated acyl-CoA thioesterase [Rhodospirillales bacterium]|jgi:acyl-CoA thioester hydrolase
MPESLVSAEAKTHVFPVRIYYEDTDAGGVVYYANYLKYAERARTEMLREHNIESSRLMAEYNVAFAVRRTEADYLRPAYLDDALEVHSRLLKIGGATLTAEQIVRRDGEDLVIFQMKLACVGLSSGPERIPKSISSILKLLCHT